jgi:hypothetical protein
MMLPRSGTASPADAMSRSRSRWRRGRDGRARHSEWSLHKRRVRDAAQETRFGEEAE